VSRSFVVLPAVTGMLLGAARLDAQQGNTMFRADPAHRGVYEVAPVTTLGRLRWRFAVAGPVRSTPAIFDGVVYVGSGDGSIHAIDLETGEGRWRFDAGAALPFDWGHESGDWFVSSPTLEGDALHFGAGDGGVYRLDRATGTLRVATSDGGPRAIHPGGSGRHGRRGQHGRVGVLPPCGFRGADSPVRYGRTVAVFGRVRV